MTDNKFFDRARRSLSRLAARRVALGFVLALSVAACTRTGVSQQIASTSAAPVVSSTAATSA